ncbi:MAG: hypothetical protein ACI4MH_06860 [Candidatus Coproplasma sp.]
MNKKILTAIAAVAAITVLGACVVGCNGGETPEESNALTAQEAAEKIAGFTSSPTTVNATFKQDYELIVNSENASMKAFEKDIDDTVTVQADYTSGNLYYYGKKVAKDNSVTEQLLFKEGDSYYYMTTTTVKTVLESESAARAKIDELMTALTKQTSGYVDSDAFTYGTAWIHDYVLLGSGSIEGTESSYFTYDYEKTEGDGLKITMDLKYVGYYGDAGTFEFSTDATHTGSQATLETDSNGYVLSFSQTLNNHLDMNITNPAVPLDLTGTRSLTATYNGTIDKKTTITQDITPGTINVSSVEHATVATYDFKNGDYSTLANPSSTVSAGNFVAIKVTCDEGYEVSSVTVNGNATQLINGYYCYMTPAEAGKAYNVAVVVTAQGEEAPTTSAITVNSVEHATVETYDFKYGDYSTLGTPSTVVTAGNFVAVKVTCEAGYDVTDVTVNGNATQYINGYYCYMSAAVAGTTYAVEVTVSQAPSSIACASVEHATIETYDFKYGDYSTLSTPSTTVSAGNFVAVKVTCDAGYEVTAVTVNGNATQFINGYYCYMTAAVSGETYTVVVTVAPSAN